MTTARKDCKFRNPQNGYCSKARELCSEVADKYCPLILINEILLMKILIEKDDDSNWDGE